MTPKYDDPEMWMSIPGTEIFQVSSHGRVRNLRMQRFVNIGEHKGYSRVNLYEDGKQRHVHLHRLVAEAFLPGYSKTKMVDHHDGNTRNNHYTNLFYNGRVRRIFPDNVRVLVNETGALYHTIGDAAKAVDGQPFNVRRVLDGRLKSHKGHTFRLVVLPGES